MTLNSPSPRRSTACASSRSRTGTGRSAPPWERCAVVHSGEHRKQILSVLFTTCGAAALAVGN